MLLVECAVCGRRELRGVRSIERLEHTGAEIVISVPCRGCGYRNRIRTGARAHLPVPRAS